MKLLTKAIRERLLANGRLSARGQQDHVPVVKLFTPDANCTWLLTEIDPTYHEDDLAFGLCDLGLGCAEVGSVSLSEILAVRGRLGLPVERDRWFSTREPLSRWAEASRGPGRITAPARPVSDPGTRAEKCLCGDCNGDGFDLFPHKADAR